LAQSEKKAQEALKISEEQFRKAIEEAPIPTILQAEDGQVLQLSSSWTELTGYKLSDIATFDNWVTNAVYDGADAVRDHMRELFKEKSRSINVTFSVRTHNKGIREWSFSASSPGTLIDGRRFIIGMAVDITERKKVEEELSDVKDRIANELKELSMFHQKSMRLMSLQNMDELFDGILDAALGLVHADRGNIQLADDNGNLTIQAQRGFSKAWLDFFSVVTKESAATCGQVKATKGKVIVEDVKTSPIFAGTPSRQVQLREGVLAIISIPLIASSGEVIGVISTHFRKPNKPSETELYLFDLLASYAADLIERKKAEESLRKTEEQNRKQLEEISFYYDNAPVGLAVLDKDLRYIRVNARLAEINGVPAREHIGKTIRDIVPNLADAAEQLSQRVLAGEAVRNTEFTGETSAQPGVQRTWLESVVPVKDFSGKVNGIYVVAQEITERKLLTKQLRDSERLAAIGATAGMVGHDIRNPLQAMLSDVYLLKNEITLMPQSETKKGLVESLDSLEQNISYINKIVQDLQDFARPIKPEIMESNLSDIFAKVFTNIKVPDSVKLSIKVEDLEKFRTDPMLLQRAISNLITNAIQAMPDGGILSITGAPKDKKAVITISDTGSGIPEEIKPKLFTPMMTTKAKGQGFGLAVSKRLIEAMEGIITFESEAGKGTKFLIELPN
jgi:PAS domain S-box-containing protein